jgi:ribosomal protein S18 acetylase RimI-like enzyme
MTAEFNPAAVMPDTKFRLLTAVTIRGCTAEDLADLEWYGMFTPHREIVCDAFRRHLREENIMLLADLNGFPVGQVWIDMMRFRRQKVGYIWALRVFPFLRGMGIGRRLVRAAERELAARGYREAEMAVEKTGRAIQLYERLGYRRVGARYEQYSYRRPDGDVVQVPQDLWVLRRRFSRRFIQRWRQRAAWQRSKQQFAGTH